MGNLRKNINFCIPDIGEEEIEEVVDTLRTGWITTGKKVKRFEEELRKYCGVEGAICLSSGSAGLELSLRVLGIGEGDEVITTGYTYCATANAIIHTGARVVFVDIEGGDFNISSRLIGEAITCKTKAVIVVDFGGFPVDYEGVKSVLELKKGLYFPRRGSVQEYFDRVILLADSAHSFGARYGGRKLGGIADFTVFSFHSVKNLTTGEGGVVTFNGLVGLGAGELYERFRLYSLHGQDKDALKKNTEGGWKYSIELVGYKYNMTDIAASLGLVQLRRYEGEILARRKEVVKKYEEYLRGDSRIIFPRLRDRYRESSDHLLALRIKGWGEESRDGFIQKMEEEGVMLNVHFIPVMMHRAYRRLGYSMADYPGTYKMYENEVSVPVYSKLRDEEVEYICERFQKNLRDF